jgi:hypothetical protein
MEELTAMPDDEEKQYKARKMRVGTVKKFIAVTTSL